MMASRQFLRTPVCSKMLYIQRRQLSTIAQQTRLFSVFRPPAHFSNAFRSTARFPLRRIRQQQLFNSKRFNSTKAVDDIPTSGPLTLGQKMKKLSKEYGYSAVAVYFLLSLLDFPFCFLTVRVVGSDKIAKYEHAVVAFFWRSLDSLGVYHHVPKPISVGEPGFEGEGEGGTHVTEKGVSIWTELALAYAFHKSLIFFRVPLAVAVTPKIVKMLRQWGFNIGNKRGVREGVAGVRSNLAARKIERAAEKAAK